MLAAVIAQRVFASYWTVRLGRFLFASYWHQDFATCVSIKIMPTILRVRHLQQAKQVLSLSNQTSNAIFHGKKTIL
jgi:hypothetical protein